MTALFLFVALFSSNVFAWGHLDFSKKWSSAYLVFKAIDDSQIDYCVEIQSKRFTESEIKLQTKFAIELWLMQVEDMLPTAVTVNYDCDPKTVDVIVKFGSEKAYPHLRAYQLPKNVNGRWISTVSVNTDPFQYGASPKKATYKSFFGFFGPLNKPSEKVALLEEISITAPTTVSQLAAELNLPYNTVYWTSYRVLLHELGHSFGLCDTIPSQYHYCDKSHRTLAHPDALMHRSRPIFIHSDDRLGIRKLFERFL